MHSLNFFALKRRPSVAYVFDEWSNPRTVYPSNSIVNASLRNELKFFFEEVDKVLAFITDIGNIIAERMPVDVQRSDKIIDVRLTKIINSTNTVIS